VVPRLITWHALFGGESAHKVVFCPGAMFFRLKPSGPRTYLQIVENRREDGAHRQHVIATLGRADELAASGALANLLASGARLCDQVMLLSALERDVEGLRRHRQRMARPVCKGILTSQSDQSTSTYPVSGHCPGQDGEPRVPGLIS
jgi:hypothetical protein